MKGNELIELIKSRNLEEFEVEFVFMDGHNIFPNIRVFKVTDIADIGYSSKVLRLDGDEYK